ncbi:uncharacterized protein VTP21DRAFT_8703 [Calcarisporiella thermophila]|uniref:uncharacterized protein n=1 Tax=Calcarisporiella thermophila TaxID=911321 RepID=UPI0037444033
MMLKRKSRHRCIVNLARDRELGQYHSRHPMTVAREFYSILAPNTILYNIQVYPGLVMRRFTPDGKHLICFSRRQTAIRLYNFLGVCSVGTEEVSQGDESDVSFEKFFSFRYEQVVTENADQQLCKDFCIIMPDQRLMILASTGTIVQEVPQNERHLLRYIPQIEDYVFYVVDIATGEVKDKKSYKNDYIPLQNHSGVALYGRIFAITSIKNQTISLLQIKEDGKIVELRRIGAFTYDDDELLLAFHQEQEDRYLASRRQLNAWRAGRISGEDIDMEIEAATNSTTFAPLSDLSELSHQVPCVNPVAPATSVSGGATVLSFLNNLSSLNETTNDFSNSPNIEREPIGGIRHRLLSYLFRKAYCANDRGTSLRHFYRNFNYFHSLVISRSQFLDDEHLLIRFVNPEARQNESGSGTVLFVIYNFHTTQVVAVYDDTSEELLTLFEENMDTFRDTGDMPHTSFVSTYSNNIATRELLRKQKYAIIHSRNGGLSQFVRRTLSLLPFSPQSFSESPYFDLGLYSYDEKLMGALERPRHTQDYPIRFYSRRTGELKFKLDPNPPNRTLRGIKRYVHFIAHPIYPFIISVQYSIMHATAVNIHLQEA